MTTVDSPAAKLVGMALSDDQKSSLRTTLREQRDQLMSTPEVKTRADSAIVSFAAAYVRGLENPHPRVAAYSPLPNEPGSNLLLDALNSQAAEIYLPITRKDGSLRWAKYRGLTDLATGSLGIWQPTGPQYTSNLLKSCDVIFVPATSIDRNGNRLGKGAGYYDRALATVRGTVPLIGLVYHNELTDEVPSGEHDVPVDAVITNRGLFDL